MTAGAAFGAAFDAGRLDVAGASLGAPCCLALGVACATFDACLAAAGCAALGAALVAGFGGVFGSTFEVALEVGLGAVFGATAALAAVADWGAACRPGVVAPLGAAFEEVEALSAGLVTVCGVTPAAALVDGFDTTAVLAVGLAFGAGATFDRVLVAVGVATLELFLTRVLVTAALTVPFVDSGGFAPLLCPLPDAAASAWSSERTSSSSSPSILPLLSVRGMRAMEATESPSRIFIMATPCAGRPL